MIARRSNPVTVLAAVDRLPLGTSAPAIGPLVRDSLAAMVVAELHRGASPVMLPPRGSGAHGHHSSAAAGATA